MIKKSMKILVIDDDPSMVKVLNKWLKVAGREIVSAFTGEEGIEKAKAEKPDCILLDVMLPGMGGQEVAKELISDPETKEIPIIFITAMMGVEHDKGDETLEIEGTKLRVFAKPLHNRKLLAEIRKAINRRMHGNS